MNFLSILTNFFNLPQFAEIFKGKEAKKREFVLKLNEYMQTQNNAQIEVNKQEAKHVSIFVAGWRPFIGWVCGTAFAYHYILKDLLLNLFQIKPLIITDIKEVISLLIAMLGMAGIRSYDKSQTQKTNK